MAFDVVALSEWLSAETNDSIVWQQRLKDRQGNFFENLNAALLGDGFVIDVPDGTVIEQPVELLHVSTGEGENVLSHPRHILRVGEGAELRLIEQHLAVDAGSYFKNQVLEVELGHGARVLHERVQEEGAKGNHLSTIRISQQAESHYHMVTATLGGAWVRTDIRLMFNGADANAEFDGFYLAGDKEVSDLHIQVEHAMPRCASREDFKGILDGSGRAVFDGCVHVAKDAQKTDARLSNHNLMLTRKAEVDTKPQLEIEADDVSCSHGTTVGQLDEQMLFYLRSRGIGLTEARQMLCR
jgi:Fe-S cluster assembly protein SufD